MQAVCADDVLRGRVGRRMGWSLGGVGRDAVACRHGRFRGPQEAAVNFKTFKGDWRDSNP